MEPLERVHLGRTGVETTRMGIGLAPLIGHAGAIDDALADIIVRAACDAGLRYVDVAPLYGLGRGEAALRRLADHPAGSSVVVSTKVGRSLRPRSVRNRFMVRLQEVRYARHRGRVLASYAGIASGRLAPARSATPLQGPRDTAEPSHVVAIQDFSPEGIRRSARESLARLGRDTVDIMFLHDPDGLGRAAVTAAWRPLEAMRAEGTVRAIGISSNDSASLSAMLQQLDPDVVLLAGRYTLLDQAAARDLLPLAVRRGVPVILGGVFNGGILADPIGNQTFDYRPASPERRESASRLLAVGRQHGVPLAAAAIQFAAAHPAVTSIVVGVRSVPELADDLSMARLPIPGAYWTALVEEGLLPGDAFVPSEDVMRDARTG